jgi:hypothetical protein
MSFADCGSTCDGRRAGMSRWLIVAVVAVTAALVLAPSALALTWGTPVTVSGSDALPAAGFATTPDLAMDAAGDAMAVYELPTGTNGSCPCTIRTAFRVAGGAFQAPLTVPSAPSTMLIGAPRVAMDAAGDAVVAWSAGSGTDDSTTQTYASLRPAGGSFGAPVQVSTNARGGDDATVVMDAAGDADVAFDTTETAASPFPLGLEVAHMTAGGSFGTPQVVTSTAVSLPLGLSKGNLAMSPDGRAIVAFTACAANSGCN